MSRGELVDESASRRRSTRDGSGRGLDVLRPSRRRRITRRSTPNTLLTPHMAGLTRAGLDGSGTRTQHRAIQRGEPPQWVVPELADLIRWWYAASCEHGDDGLVLDDVVRHRPGSTWSASRTGMGAFAGI
jgi:hypothetical protein